MCLEWCCAKGIEAARRCCLLGVRSSEPERVNLALAGHPETNSILVPVLFHKSIGEPQMLPVNSTEHFFAALAAVFTVHLRKFYFGFVSKFCHAWKSLHVKRSLQEAYKENRACSV